MNKKLVLLSSSLVVGLAIISVSHLVNTYANDLDRTCTEIEPLIIETSRSDYNSEATMQGELVYPESPEITFQEVNDTVYTTSAVNLRLEPNLNSEVYRVMNYSVHLTRVGYSEAGWSQIALDNSIYYISNDYIEKVTPERLADIELLARIIWAESGNQSLEGQRAVGSVVYNRWKYGGYGSSDTILGVITYPGQFCGYQSPQWYAEYSQDTYRIASEVYDGYTNLPYNVKNFKTNDCHANWNLEVYKVIGDHTFYYSD